MTEDDFEMSPVRTTATVAVVASDGTVTTSVSSEVDVGPVRVTEMGADGIAGSNRAPSNSRKGLRTRDGSALVATVPERVSGADTERALMIWRRVAVRREGEIDKICQPAPAADVSWKPDGMSHSNRMGPLVDPGLSF